MEDATTVAPIAPEPEIFTAETEPVTEDASVPIDAETEAVEDSFPIPEGAPIQEPAGT